MNIRIKQISLAVACFFIGMLVNWGLQIHYCFSWHESHPWSTRLGITNMSLAGPSFAFLMIQENSPMFGLLFALAFTLLPLGGLALCIPSRDGGRISLHFVQEASLVR